MQGGFRSSEQGSDQVVRTQESISSLLTLVTRIRSRSDISLKTTALSLSR